MTVYTTGDWINGCTHHVVDDTWQKPDQNSIMAFFLKMDEERLVEELANETQAGTLTDSEAERIIQGWLRKKTFNAYEGGE